MFDLGIYIYVVSNVMIYVFFLCFFFIPTKYFRVKFTVAILHFLYILHYLCDIGLRTVNGAFLDHLHILKLALKLIHMYVKKYFISLVKVYVRKKIMRKIDRSSQICLLCNFCDSKKFAKLITREKGKALKPFPNQQQKKILMCVIYYI